MPRAKRSRIKWKGQLAKRFNIDAVVPAVGLCSEQEKTEYYDRCFAALQSHRQEMMVEAGRQMGIEVEGFFHQGFEGMAKLYFAVALGFALELNVQGFLPKQPKHRPVLIRLLREMFDYGKSQNKKGTDQKFILEFLKHTEPHLTRTELRNRALILRNLISADRVKSKREKYRAREAADRARIERGPGEKLH
jgi:hypothetical protein